MKNLEKIDVGEAKKRKLLHRIRKIDCEVFAHICQNVPFNSELLVVDLDEWTSNGIEETGILRIAFISFESFVDPRVPINLSTMLKSRYLAERFEDVLKRNTDQNWFV